MVVLTAAIVATVITAGAASAPSAAAIAAETATAAGTAAAMLYGDTLLCKMVVLTAAVVATVVTARAAAPPAAVAAGTPNVAAGMAAAAEAAVAAGGGAVTVTSGAMTVAVALGPVACIVIGNVGATFDCWKPLVHDVSPEPSCGIRLRDLVLDSRVRQVDITPTCTDNLPSTSLPQIVFHNIWDERFRLEYVTMPSGEIAGHVVQF